VLEQIQKPTYKMEVPEQNCQHEISKRILKINLTKRKFQERIANTSFPERIDKWSYENKNTRNELPTHCQNEFTMDLMKWKMTEMNCQHNR